MTPFDGIVLPTENRVVATRKNGSPRHRKLNRAAAAVQLERLGGQLWFFADAELQPLGDVLIALSQALKYDELSDKRIVRLLSEGRAFTLSNNLENGRIATRVVETAPHEQYARAIEAVDDFLNSKGDATCLPDVAAVRFNDSWIYQKKAAWFVANRVRTAVKAHDKELDAASWRDALTRLTPAQLKVADTVVDAAIEASGVAKSRIRQRNEVERGRRRRAQRSK